MTKAVVLNQFNQLLLYILLIDDLRELHRDKDKVSGTAVLYFIDVEVFFCFKFGRSTNFYFDR